MNSFKIQNGILAAVFPALLPALLSAPSAQAFTLTLPPGIKGWNTRTLVFHVDTSGCGIADETLFTAIDKAFELWSSVPTSNLKIERGSATTETYASFIAKLTASTAGDPVIFCDSSFESNSGIDGDFTIGYAITDYVASGSAWPSNIFYGGVVLNAESGKLANIANLNPTQLAVSIAHEIGHTLGIGHSADPNSIMSYDHNESEIRLGQDDVNALNYLYPRWEGGGDRMFGCAPANASEPGGSRDDSGASSALQLGLLLSLCYGLSRVLRRGRAGS